jgi:hypothetical protein
MLVWKLESTFPVLNHLRVIFWGEKPWDSQMKLTLCSGAALVLGPDITGGRVSLQRAFIDKRHNCDGHHS